MNTLVLVPGLGSDAAVWEPTIEALGGEVRCIVGETRLDDSIPGMAQRVLDQAPAQFALAGVSMGGIVAMQMMAMQPKRISHLVLSDTIARPDSLYMKLYRRVSNLLVSVGDLRSLSKFSVRSMVHSSASPEVRQTLIDMGVRVGADVYRRQNRAVSKRRDYRPGLSLVSVPTRIVVGKQDRMTPLREAQEIARHIPGATLRIIEDCGHLPPIEQPKIMAEMIHQILTQASDARGDSRSQTEGAIMYLPSQCD